MIPVVPQPEPEDFDEKIRTPGLAYLATFGAKIPTSDDLNKKPLWRDCILAMRKAYGGYCAYLAHYIPQGVTTATIDHFVPKAGTSGNCKLAYEWSNFRFCCGPINNIKGTKITILDPFLIKDEWFIMDFPTLVIKANPEPLQKIMLP